MKLRLESKGIKLVASSIALLVLLKLYTSKKGEDSRVKGVIEEYLGK